MYGAAECPAALAGTGLRGAQRHLLTFALLLALSLLCVGYNKSLTPGTKGSLLNRCEVPSSSQIHILSNFPVTCTRAAVSKYLDTAVYLMGIQANWTAPHR